MIVIRIFASDHAHRAYCPVSVPPAPAGIPGPFPRVVMVASPSPSGPRRPVTARLAATMRRRVITVLGVLPLLVGCSPLTALNALSPSDGGETQAVAGASYGADPRQKLDVYAPAGAAKKR